ncbi:MAG TPA: 2-dehydro-3-deoxy-D-gluconate 5-dehydrogenase KduD [Oscillospiraceae bacterium]|nr:2-dehydro-3-deoxy-D-gluconate 5-dehydrogenase KduD [Oscillospiraceae bacterium]HPS33916.1 2-dehydro-3-deoxy-D-gluconate 5-dehydrogenase KduD [Oscillospiraceae bacterium]
MSVDFSLKSKVAIVTGCSAGIGNGIAKGLAEAGAEIYGVSSRGEFAEIKEAVEARGRRFEGRKANLMTVGPIESIINDCITKFGRVDILVNNAGIIRREDAINFSEKDWDDVMNINLKTVFFFSQRVAKEFIKQGSGKIINIASMLSYQGGIQVPSYCASKSGVKGITMELANEWAKYNINVNAIAPGYIATNITAPLSDDAERSADILARIPAGRWGTPEDVAGVAVFLASSASDYVNGFTVACDGGWLAR